jgi:adenylyltransferase/sulfurtransferase
MVASYQVCQALKLLTNAQAEIQAGLLQIDPWHNDSDQIEVLRNPNCPTCGKHDYQLLGKTSTITASSLCGRVEYQVIPASKGELDLAAMARALRSQGDILLSPFILSFTSNKLRFKLFADGRMMLKGANSPEQALAIYSEYVGL